MERKTIEIYKGDEYRTRIDNAFKESDIFQEIYTRAGKILKEIIEEEWKFCKEREEGSGFSSGFQGMSNNIIAFCADRGQGKTSAMLSFAKVLKGGLKDDSLREKLLKQWEVSGEFYVLDTINPSDLESDESIIRVIISRLFYILEEKKDKGRFPNDANLRMHVEKILELFKRCYENVDYLKNQKNKMGYQDDLEYLSRLGDSSRLKDNLYALIQKFLEFEKEEATEKERFLVIPIDDADLSVKRAFPICEDIRKYLSIPNVVILMAANFEQLYHVVYQDSLLQFKTIVETKSDASREFKIEDKCREMSAKYLEKLLPSAHRLELPEIEFIMKRQPNALEILYIVDDKNVFENLTKSCNGLQEQLLKLLYIKTGVVLLKGEGQMATFLPHTLRELTQFIKLLYDMEDVQLEIAYQKFGMLEQEGDDVLPQLYEAEKELGKLRQNLQVLRKYYLSNWCLRYLEFSARERMEELERMDLDSLGAHIKEKLPDPSPQMQEAVELCYTIYMNEFFLEVAEDREKLKQMQNFAESILNISKVCGTEESVTGYHAYNFSIDIQKMKEYFPKDTLDGKAMQWIEVWCSLKFESGYIGNKELLNESQDGWNSGISEIQFNALNPMISILGKPELLIKKVEEKTLEEESKEKKDKDWNDIAVYFIHMKDFIAVRKLWEYIRDGIKTEIGAKATKEDVKWKSQMVAIYEEIGKVSHEKLGYLDRKEFSIISFVKKTQEYIVGDKVFLSNADNQTKYLSDYEQAFQSWIDKAIDALEAICGMEEMDRKNVANTAEYIKGLKELLSGKISDHLIVQLPSDIEQVILGERFTWVGNARSVIQGVIEDMDKELERPFCMEERIESLKKIKKVKKGAARAKKF